MLPGKQLAFLVNLKPVIANQRWQSNRLGNLRVWALFPFQFQKWIWRLALSIHKIRRNIQGWGSLSVPSKKYPVLIHPELWWFFFSGPELFVLSTKAWLRKGLSWISCRKTVTLQQLCPEVAYLEPVFLLAYFFLCFPIELHMKWHTHGMLHVLRV